MDVLRNFCLASTAALVMGSHTVALSQLSSPPPSVTLWLMPAEPPAEDTPPVRTRVDDEIADFNKEFGDGRPVTVLNTTVQHRRAQLIVWNPQFAVPSWAMVKGQHDVLRALEGFASKRRIHINVLFIDWGRAFDELQRATTTRMQAKYDPSEPAPDVAQVGSTWVAFFAREGLLIPDDGNGPPGALKWRAAPGKPRASLRYTLDTRLLFYWKRHPLASQAARPFNLNSSSWEAILGSLRERAAEAELQPHPPMVMQVGMTLDLLHNYAPLVWASGGNFLRETRFRKYVDLTSAEALDVPTLLTEKSVAVDAENHPQPIVAFPEMSTEEATRHFLKGDYVAIQKPAGFVKRWYTEFYRARHTDYSIPRGGGFWDYAGVATTPSTFNGGSDLMIVKGTGQQGTAFDLAEFLVSDPEYTGTIAKFEGYLPAQVDGNGLDPLVDSLLAPSGVVPREEAVPRSQYKALVLEAIAKGREYPELDTFPVYLESHEALESIQRLFRRISEGNKTRVREAAREAELTVNSKLDWWTRSLLVASAWWPAALLVAFGGAAGVFYHKRQIYERERRAHDFDRLLQLSIALLRRGAFVLISRVLAWFSDCHRLTRSEVSKRAKLLIELRRKSMELESEIREDLEAERQALDGPTTEQRDRRVPPSRAPDTLLEVVEAGWEIALSQYAVANPSNTHPPDLGPDKSLDQWVLDRQPGILKAVLLEWFYNCLKQDSETKTEVAIYKRSDELGIEIVSGAVFTRIQMTPMFGEWDEENLQQAANAFGQFQAFALISLMCEKAFGRRPGYFWLDGHGSNIEAGETLRPGLRSTLRILLPMRKIGEGDFYGEESSSLDS
jgi:hypothetical protein